MKIDGVHSYKIHIYGQVEEEDICSTSPVQFTIEQVDEASTTITLRTDQSGLIGLIRHLHGMGFVIISMSSEAVHLPWTVEEVSPGG